MNEEIDLEELRSRFFKVYSNVPLGFRNEIVSVVDDEPITWTVAYIEINNATEKSENILTTLSSLSII